MGGGEIEIENNTRVTIERHTRGITLPHGDTCFDGKTASNRVDLGSSTVDQGGHVVLRNNFFF